MTDVERQLVAAFKRGVKFRETTNAPLPDDAEILLKIRRLGLAPVPSCVNGEPGR